MRAEQLAHGLAEAQALFLVDPDFRLLDVATHVERQQRGQQAHREHPSPTQRRHHQRGDDGGSGITGSKGTLDPRQDLAAVLCRPALAHQRRAGGPFTANAQANDDPEQHQLPQRVRQAAQRGTDRVADDAEHHRLGAAHAVGQIAKQQAAKCRGQQRGRHHHARLRLVEAQVRTDVLEHHREQHQVHHVQHPAQVGRTERPPLLLAGALPPATAAGRYLLDC
ncbi:hypothetical protein D3C81_716550 [compost metagenome]